MTSVGGQAGGLFEVRPDLRAVAVDVRVKDRRERERGELAHQVDCAAAGGIAPAVRRDDAVARVERDDDAFRVGLCGVSTSSGSRIAAVPSTTRSTPSCEIAIDRVDRANAAADLHAGSEGSDDPPHQLALRGLAVARAVEVDHVQPLDASGPARGQTGGLSS